MTTSTDLIRPHTLQTVELAHLGAEQMDDHVIRVDQHPVCLPHALKPENFNAGLLQPDFRCSAMAATCREEVPLAITI